MRAPPPRLDRYLSCGMRAPARQRLSRPPAYLIGPSLGCCAILPIQADGSMDALRWLGYLVIRLDLSPRPRNGSRFRSPPLSLRKSLTQPSTGFEDMSRPT